jgi:SAM-dependent methyltransferase
VAVDRDADALATLADAGGVRTVVADLEGGGWPLADATADAVIVTNYLHRPLFPHLVTLLKAGGVLIYETFMVGNERHGRPSNPDFLLRPDELLDAFRASLHIVAFEQGELERPQPAVVQRLCAVAGAAPRTLLP